MLVATWVKDQLVAANQNRVDFQEFGWWILKRREVLNGPSAVVSRVPLELPDAEIKQGLIEGSRSLLEPQHQEIMQAVRIQRLKRRETSPEDPTKSNWVSGKSVRVIFPADELRQKFFSWGEHIFYGNMSPSGSMFLPPSTALSAK